MSEKLITADCPSDFIESTNGYRYILVRKYKEMLVKNTNINFALCEEIKKLKADKAVLIETCNFIGLTQILDCPDEYKLKVIYNKTKETFNKVGE